MRNVLALHCSGFHKSDVQFPIPTERSLLDLVLAKQEIQRRTDFIPALSKLCGQIIFANHHLPTRVEAMNVAFIVVDLVSDRANLFSFFLCSLGTFGAYFVCLIGSRGCDCNSDSMSKRPPPSPL